MTTKPHSNDEVIDAIIHRLVAHILGTANWESNIDFIEIELRTLLAQKDAEMLQRVGMLRQWLNEDRITDTKRMVTNAELLVWLTPPDQTANPTN